MNTGNKYKYDRVLLKNIKDNVAIGVWQERHPLLFDYLYENEERKKELLDFLNKYGQTDY